MSTPITNEDLLANAEFARELRDLAGFTRYALADKWEISASRVQRLRYKVRDADEAAGRPPVAEKETTESSTDGTRSIQFIRDRPITLDDARDWIKESGDDPEDFELSVRSIAYGGDKSSNKMSAAPKRAGKGSGPAWPIVHQVFRVEVLPPAVRVEPVAGIPGLKLGMKCGDPQIGFRALPNGTFDPFHDEQAMDLFVEVCRVYQPDVIHILGDFLDLSSQSHFSQEASFARTTQMAVDAGYRFLAKLRAACPRARIILIEGNHDKRMQNYIELNALSAFGLKRADAPDELPVMSIPFLLRLAELDIEYVDAYPAATDWDNANTRNIHGTKANSKGSTMSQYVFDLPHINTWAGHTHRTEIIYHSGIGHLGAPIESYGANCGVLCRTDGAVPSVNGAIGASGIPVQIVENWQQGLGLHYFNETDSFPQVFRIRNGSVIMGDRVISVPDPRGEAVALAA